MPEEKSPVDTLRAFLDRTKAEYLEAVRNGRGKEWTVVMGNEAGDLDSLACAVAYAWYLSDVQQTPAVALVQTPRGDLHLRAENAHALALAGVSLDELLCVDDVLPPSSSSPFPSTTFALVDHNRLNAQFSADNSAARVVAIIDHHADEGLHTDADPRIVTQGVGSCAALVALFLQDKCAEKIPPELAVLLLSAIVVDTGGMVPGGKAVEVDRRAAVFLASRCTLASRSPNLAASSLALRSPAAIPPLHKSEAIQKLNGTLQMKKNSVAHLGVRDLLRRDYKEYAHTPAFAPSRELLIGLASVPLGLATLVPRDEAQFVNDTKHYMDERGLTALGVLTSFRDDKKPGKGGKGKHRREQLWVVHASDDVQSELARRLFRGLEENDVLQLKKRKWEKIGADPAVWDRSGGAFGEGWRVKAWKQKNADATRKATAPIVKAIVEGRE
ncbi:DHH phosphoesterase [Rhodofomes roseus]|uniref:DHH phosphoesterase n=1 Tax=Rhodofomes roseus TaxID=34475 RepID=A0ABQ8KBF3_9APHY|nr:DHH phosphoesterase [Rhodofomes roseus]KAH9834871.1 DHH phosphoesterase [Rhodofomes roseus]